MVDVVRRLTVVGQSEGLEKVAGDLNRVAVAQRDVASASSAAATTTDQSSKRTLSAATAYDRLRASVDSSYRAEQQLARGEATLDRAFQTGRINAAEYAQTLGLLQTKMVSTAAGGRQAAGAMAGLRNGLSGAFAGGLLGGAAAQLMNPTELVAGVGRAISALDDLGDAAQRAGVSGEQLQVLRYALEQTAGSAEHADTAFSKLNVGLGQALNTGKGPAAGAFKQLGIDLLDASGNAKTTGDVFVEIAAKLPLVEGAAQRAAFAAALFGKASGPEMAALLTSGSASLASYEAHLRSMGGVMSGEMLQKADELQKKINDLSIRWGSAWQRMAIIAATSVTEIGRWEHTAVDNLSATLTEIGRVEHAAVDAVASILTEIGRLEHAAVGAVTAAPSIGGGSLDDFIRRGGHSSGGYISGPGSSTSDSIPARLSNGEFVVNARATRHYRAQLEAMNRGYASGGAVQSATVTETGEAMQRLIERTNEARDTFSGVLTGIIAQLQQGKSLWESFGSTALSVLEKIEDRLLQMVENRFLDALFGKQGTAGGGLFGRMLGGGASAAAPLIGGVGGPAAGSFRAAQEYSGAGVGTRLNAPLGPAAGSFRAAQQAGIGGGSVAQQTWNFWKSKGLPDYKIAGIMGNVGGESGFNPLAPGDSGNAIGLYQHNGPRMRSLLGAIGGRGNLGNVQAQNEFAYSELMGPENAAWKRLQGSTDVAGATRAFGQGFERPKVFNFDERFQQAQEAMKNFGQSSTEISQSADKFSGDFSGSLTSLASSVGQTGNQFSNSFMSALQNVMSGLGGGGGGLSSLALSAIASTGGAGLFASGGTVPAGRWGIVGERGPERVFGPATVVPGRGGGGTVIKEETHYHDYVGVRVEKSTTRDQDGNVRHDVVIKGMVSGALADPAVRRGAGFAPQTVRR